KDCVRDEWIGEGPLIAAPDDGIRPAIAGNRGVDRRAIAEPDRRDGNIEDDAWPALDAGAQDHVAIQPPDGRVLGDAICLESVRGDIHDLAIVGITESTSENDFRR